MEVQELLAICQSKLGNQIGAKELWNSVIKECVDSCELLREYVKYPTKLSLNSEALSILLKCVKSVSKTDQPWELGYNIVNNEKELEEISMQWTKED